MRFILAVVSLVLAVVLIGFGIAQRTVLAGPDSLTAAIDSSSEAPVTVIDGETLNSLPGLQDVRIEGETIFAAYGRTTDVIAWVGDATYDRIGYDSETHELTSDVVTGDEATVPSAAGSDLWLKQYSAEGDLRMPIRLDPEFSIILLADGTGPAPSDVSITWPIDNRTPWAGPLVAGGAAMLILALFFFLWGVLHQRRARGPRRKSIRPAARTRMPKLPRQRSYRVRKPKPVTSARGRRSRRMVAILPTAVVALVALSGCSSDFWPRIGDLPAPSPSPSASSDVAEPTPAAATVTQVRSIVGDVAEVATDADAALDTDAITARFDGPALAARLANYRIRTADSAAAAPASIPTDSVPVSLPQITGDTWPRSMFVVTQSAADQTSAPVALTLVQASPRDQYKVVYALTLEPDHTLPQLAPEGVGALPLGPESPVLLMPPGELAAAYVDVVENGDASASATLFDLSQDNYAPSVAANRESVRTAINTIGTAEFTLAPSDDRPIALSSNEAGALVNITLTDTATVTPAEAGATINPEGSIQSLSGVTTTTRGTLATYSNQLLFYIPPLGSDARIELLGFTSALVSASELP